MGRGSSGMKSASRASFRSEHLLLLTCVGKNVQDPVPYAVYYALMNRTDLHLCVARLLAEHTSERIQMACEREQSRRISPAQSRPRSSFPLHSPQISLITLASAGPMPSTVSLPDRTCVLPASLTVAVGRPLCCASRASVCMLSRSGTRSGRVGCPSASHAERQRATSRDSGVEEEDEGSV
jgi:hypothetical protein